MSTAAPLPEGLFDIVRGELPRWSRRRCAALASELSTLWWGLRTAVLLDTCSLSEEDATALGTALLKVRRDVFVVYEAVSGQTIIVNRDLLAEGAAEEVAFVDVGGAAPVLLDSSPPSFYSLLSSLLANPPSSSFASLTLPSPDHPADLIPLVGFLLDYPVAYCLLHERDGRNCLGGAELIVTEVELVGPGETRQRLLAFSYPARLASSISPKVTAEALEAKLRARLARVVKSHPELRGCRIEVTQRNATLDQVAL